MRLPESVRNIKLPKMVKPACSSCQDLVDIGLVSHIPYDSIPGTVKDLVEADSDLHDSQIGSQMPSCGRDLLHQKIADGIRQERKLLVIHRLKVFRKMIPS